MGQRQLTLQTRWCTSTGERNYSRLGSDKTTHPHLVNVITIQQPRFTGFLPGQNYLKNESWPQLKQLFQRFCSLKIDKNQSHRIHRIHVFFLHIYEWLILYGFPCRLNICRLFHRNPISRGVTTNTEVP